MIPLCKNPYRQQPKSYCGKNRSDILQGRLLHVNISLLKKTLPSMGRIATSPLFHNAIFSWAPNITDNGELLYLQLADEPDIAWIAGTLAPAVSYIREPALRAGSLMYERYCCWYLSHLWLNICVSKALTNSQSVCLAGSPFNTASFF